MFFINSSCLLESYDIKKVDFYASKAPQSPAVGTVHHLSPNQRFKNHDSGCRNFDQKKMFFQKNFIFIFCSGVIEDVFWGDMNLQSMLSFWERNLLFTMTYIVAFLPIFSEAGEIITEESFGDVLPRYLPLIFGFIQS